MRESPAGPGEICLFQSIIIADLRYSVKGTDGEEWPENTRFMGGLHKKS
ncbi:hypothetical protein HMPREF0239_01729 [Clostridium sp. ATCC BAA-442]|uniref:Uncharacterized protein n=1 Tax=Flavonifractor plautii ATCC 29863 TaxID=411475 RepID=G9YM51_FLAPL|nr:hypothetical protein HMPREF0372_00572 [Flavonifractor plautii ATCC 29863]ERI77494.1 hypothetical protein HMPREF0239_01729 [Clostridium sp. ATCC BAA-442]